MKRKLLPSYLMLHFAGSFFPLFGALFLIASVVAFVQLATMTSAIQMNFSEMLKLYITYTPNILLYTLPLTFFAAVTITLSRLSADLEMVVLFGLKADMIKVLKPFIFLSIILGASLWTLGLAVQPKAKFMQREFIHMKRMDAQINIRPSEFGQRFGDWLLFVGSQKSQTVYEDIVLFSTTKEGQSSYFVVAEKAAVSNDRGVLSLSLSTGHTYQIGEQGMIEVDFQLMRVNEAGRLSGLAFEGIAAYWADFKKSKTVALELSGAILAGLFVILCIPAAALGIHNPRFDKSHAGAMVLGFSLLFYVPAFMLSDKGTLLPLVIPPLWFALTYWLYRRRVGRTF